MSMFKIKSLTVEGFLAYGKRQRVEFPEQPGVYRIDGFNHVEPRQGSNGSGKTDILRAVSWVRYGKTHDGLFGPTIKSWLRNANNIATEVVEEGEKDGVPYTISRMQSPNKVSLNGRVIDQPELDTFLERNFSLFLASTMFPTSSQSFLSLGATAQMEKISAVLGLDAWDTRADKASKAGKVLKKEVEDLESSIGQIRSRQSVIQTTIAEQLTAQREFDERVDLEKEEDAKKAESLASSMPALPAKPQLSLECPAKAAADEASKEYERTKRLVDKHKQTEDHKTQELSTARKNLDKFSSTPSNTCYACQGIVGADVREAMELGFTAKMDTADKELASAKKILEAAISEKAEAQNLFKKFSAEAVAEEEAQKDLRTAHETDLVAWSKVKTQRANIKAQILEIQEKEYGTFDTKTLTRSRKQLADDNTRLAELEKDLQDKQNAANNHNLLAECFAKIRVAEMERGCAEFAAYMLGAFDTLGLVGYEVDVSCIREVGVKKDPKLEFNVKIKTPCHTDWVPWKSWSDGQQHRLAQAGDTAFSDLAASRCAVVNLDEFWDERTNSLSAQGCVDQMEYLDARAQTQGKVLMVIDHRTGDSPVFQGLLWVDRRKTGSIVSWKTSRTD